MKMRGLSRFQSRCLSVSSVPVSVDFMTFDGSAAAGLDYTPQNGTLTFNPGETEKAVSIDIIDDLLDENSEEFTISLSNAINALIATGIGTATILDNDPAPTISISDVVVDEGDGVATFLLTLSSASANPVTVDVSSADGTAVDGQDYSGTRRDDVDV
ncbi:MAG: Calx-beta domain-containing protein [Planctomycetaceae bacterium]